MSEEVALQRIANKRGEKLKAANEYENEESFSGNNIRGISS